MRIELRSAIVSGVIALGLVTQAYSHCDTMDGPVVKAARQALETGEPTAVLIWVQERYEAPIRKALKEALAKQKKRPELKSSVEQAFLEDVVRYHRKGEGESFTGLKPAGTDIGELLRAAEGSLASGQSAEVISAVDKKIHAEIKARLNDLLSKKQYDRANLKEGRKYAASYVSFMKFIEALDGVGAHESHHATHASHD